MTTIAYNHKSKQIACDSRMSAGSLIVTDGAVKFRKDKTGGVWFFCGDDSDVSDLIGAEHNQKFDDIPNCSALAAINGDMWLVTANIQR